VIAEVETDKAAMDIEVFDAGVLLKILAQEAKRSPPVDRSRSSEGQGRGQSPD
jgi:pyruvate/2-oxoglutarate dehydrogenase complex dihydrolipoamide acyltransferase (E2) component